MRLLSVILLGIFIVGCGNNSTENAQEPNTEKSTNLDNKYPIVGEWAIPIPTSEEQPDGETPKIIFTDDNKFYNSSDSVEGSYVLDAENGILIITAKELDVKGSKARTDTLFITMPNSNQLSVESKRQTKIVLTRIKK